MSKTSTDLQNPIRPSGEDADIFFIEDLPQNELPLTSTTEATSTTVKNPAVDLGGVSWEPMEIAIAPEATSITAMTEAAPSPAVNFDTPTVFKPKSHTPTPQAIQNFSENLPIGDPEMEVSLPFTVQIEGSLEEPYRSRLLEFLNETRSGIQEIDLQEALDAGKILLPRISETLAVRLVQKFREAPFLIRVSRSLDTGDELQSSDPGPSNHSHIRHLGEAASATKIPILTQDQITPPSPFQTSEHFDTLMVSAFLTSSSVEVERDPEFNRVFEALKREMAHQAFHKGAQAVVHLQFDLKPLLHPNQYRLILTGDAVRFK